MLFLQLLDPRARISASAAEVILGIVQFVLIEFQLRFGNIQLVLQIVLLPLVRRGELLGELCGAVQVRLDGRLGLSLPVVEFLELRRQLHSSLGRMAQRVGKSEVYLVIGHFEGPVNQLLLLGRVSQRR